MHNPVIELEQQYEQRVRQLQPYDAGFWLGYPAFAYRIYETAKDAQEALRTYSLSHALLSHTMAELHHPLKGNETLRRILEQLPGFAGVMTLLPEDTGEIKDLAVYVTDMVKSGMRAARIFPKSHRYTLRLPTIPRLLALLEQRGIPLFLPIGQSSWDEIGSLARAHPRLALIVEGTGHHEFLNIRSCLPWLKVQQNILVTTLNQFLVGGLELMVNELGAHRILFSSNQPIDDPAAGLFLLAFSDLSLEIKKKIAHENLRRLLDQVDKGGYFA